MHAGFGIFQSIDVIILLGHMLSVQFCPHTLLSQKSYFGILTPSISECDIIWWQSLHKGNQIEMKFLGWPLIQYD